MPSRRKQKRVLIERQGLLGAKMDRQDQSSTPLQKAASENEGSAGPDDTSVKGGAVMELEAQSPKAYQGSHKMLEEIRELRRRLTQTQEKSVRDYNALADAVNSLMMEMDYARQMIAMERERQMARQAG